MKRLVPVIVAPIIIVSLTLAACGTKSEDTPRTNSAPEPTTLSGIVKNADAPVGDPEVKEVRREGNSIVVTAKTPTGGFDGASTKDLDYQAGGIFSAIYGDASFKGDATLRFTGGLVDSATGKDLPKAMTSAYAMTKGEARRIDWSNQDALDYVIDWSLYRLFVHPAIKMED